MLLNSIREVRYLGTVLAVFQYLVVISDLVHVAFAPLCIGV